MAITSHTTASADASAGFAAFIPNYWDSVLGENLYQSGTFIE